MKEDLYSHRSNLIVAFHGCDQSVVEKVVLCQENLIASTNDYDWLGSGVYFWEYNESRAMEWAVDASKRPNSSIKRPAVIGAVIDLGYCMDLTDSKYLDELREAYDTLVKVLQDLQQDIPQNSGKIPDKLLRRLDCAVIEMAHVINEQSGDRAYDSVRGMFWEGQQLYPNAGFAEKNHIQICVRNPNCIKGFFIPRIIDRHFLNP